MLLVDKVSLSFDDIWEPSEKDTPSVQDYHQDPVKIDITKEDVPPALLMKVIPLLLFPDCNSDF